MKRPATTLLALLPFLTLLFLPAATAQRATIPEAALDLRNQGLAQLENERPEKAEETYRSLVSTLPEDPLGHANLAIALLRQQKFVGAVKAIDTALEKAPGRGDLLAIRGDVLQWSGDLEGALSAYRQALAATAEDPEIAFALYRHAETLDTEGAAAARSKALARMAALRPENVVVLLARGKAAIAEGDRAGATAAFLRVKELLWQAQPMAERALGLVLTALEQPDPREARVPALRLENVLKVTPMYRESLRELSTGIQGLPVETFQGEVPEGRFGEALEVRFEARLLGDGVTLGLAVGDLDGDDRSDVVRLLPDSLELRLSTAEVGTAGPRRISIPPASQPAASSGQTAAPPFSGLGAFDLNNDGHLDLLAYGPHRSLFWRGDGAGGFTEVTEDMGLAGPAVAGVRAVAPIDFDIEGDLDLAIFRDDGGDLLYNNLQGPLQPVGERALPGFPSGEAGSVVASDLDRDGDLDLLFAHSRGLTWLDNLRQGRFADRTARGGLVGAAPARVVTTADLDNDGWPEILAGGQGLTIWRNRQGRFEDGREMLDPAGPFHAVVAFDADNDGLLDIALAGPHGVQVQRRRDNPDGSGLHFLTRRPLEKAVDHLAVADLDQDGDLDLLAAASGGGGHLTRLTNEGGNKNAWLSMRLRGLDKGNSKNNLLGLGATVEVLAGSAYQFREVTGDVTHIGLGSLRRAYLARVVWTNGVPQQRLFLQGNQRVVEEQLLKGSCPFLYAWDGDRMAFVTDLLWGAPLGLPMAPDRWVAADPGELVRVDGVRPHADGRYELRITEELWEAAFFDYLRLWVVDHPEEVEVASTLRILPGQPLPEGVLASRGLRPVAAAWDGRGRDVTERVSHRDEVYADGYTPSPYQGVAAQPWTFTFDLGAPALPPQGGPVRLHLDGWIFPADASLNLAVAQRSDLTPHPPRLEVEVNGAWQVLMANMGFPAGKTKTMVVDTPPLPAGAHRLRMVTGQWLHWDRLTWTSVEGRADEEVRIVAKLEPERSELRFRGFSAPVRQAPNAPHAFDYHAATTDSPWLPFPGPYTRYGEVGELLTAVDDRNVILAPGDEIALIFNSAALAPPPPGYRRTVFLESHGWDKDADRNTWEGGGVEPLPLTALGGYPPQPTQLERGWEEPAWMEEYRRRWLTREVP